MEHAVGRLEAEGFGAVRHGAECFNFYFPQELDEEFLVISENIGGNVPWKYVDVNQLQAFLDSQIDLGYTFPLNPKWLVCDPGWKKIYDKLFASQKPNVQDSLNVWYPPESGLREQIEDITNRCPDGFQRKEKLYMAASMASLRASGTSKMDFAMAELASEGFGDRTASSQSKFEVVK
jgi:hypothetical protein